MALLKAYLSVHEMDIICLSETYLDSSVPVDDNLEIPGYSSVTADHSSNIKHGGVLMYYKNFLLIKLMLNIYMNSFISN